jgi:hypothetical protein
MDDAETVIENGIEELYLVTRNYIERCCLADEFSYNIDGLDLVQRAVHLSSMFDTTARLCLSKYDEFKKGFYGHTREYFEAPFLEQLETQFDFELKERARDINETLNQLPRVYSPREPIPRLSTDAYVYLLVNNYTQFSKDVALHALDLIKENEFQDATQLSALLLVQEAPEAKLVAFKILEALKIHEPGISSLEVELDPRYFTSEFNIAAQQHFASIKALRELKVLRDLYRADPSDEFTRKHLDFLIAQLLPIWQFPQVTSLLSDTITLLVRGGHSYENALRFIESVKDDSNYDEYSAKILAAMIENNEIIDPQLLLSITQRHYMSYDSCIAPILIYRAILAHYPDPSFYYDHIYEYLSANDYARVDSWVGLDATAEKFLLCAALVKGGYAKIYPHARTTLIELGNAGSKETQSAAAILKDALRARGQLDLQPDVIRLREHEEAEEEEKTSAASRGIGNWLSSSAQWAYSFVPDIPDLLGRYIQYVATDNPSYTNAPLPSYSPWAPSAKITQTDHLRPIGFDVTLHQAINGSISSTWQAIGR